MGHVGRSPGLARSATAVLRADTRLALVPLAAFSALGAVAVATATVVQLTLQSRTRVYGSAYRTAGLGLPHGPGPSSSAVTTIVPTWATLAALTAGYLVSAFIVTYALAVVAAATHHRLAGDRPALAHAATTALGRLPQLLAWSSFGGLVGLAHRVIEKRALLGAVTRRSTAVSWRRAAWLAIPVVVVEGRAPLRSLTRSSHLLDRTWGTGALGRTGLGPVAAALFVPAGVAAVVVGPRGPVGLAATVALLAGAAAVTTTLSTITRTALYAHATGLPVAGFDAAVLAGAFRPRRPAAPMMMVAPLPAIAEETDVAPVA